MQYVRLGSSGLKVSRLGLGMMSYGDPARLRWSLAEDAAEPIVRRAVEAGVTFFDTADMYSGGASEEITGRLLRKLFGKRDDYVLATKVYYPTGHGPNDRGLSRAHVLAAVDASLRRLGTDHIDLYQLHRWDPETPIEETLAALDDVVRAGKVRYLGASLMYAWQFAKAQYTARLGGWTQFVSMQTRYNLVYREEEREILPQCADLGVGVLPYSPLAGGDLARVGLHAGGTPSARAAVRGSRARADGDTGNSQEVLHALAAVAAVRGVPPACIALAWLLGRPAVNAPIVGATRQGHLDEAVAALDLVLDEEETKRLEEPYHPRAPYGYS
ncbi:aldo/keto reductase [Actinopolymorpha rutila]|uniref:Aryl-alcohol dehydrogenase-like predicted oxidoreductase n=1 Tax=Actinopolymorpha rutila TaxID=446787 RepID=A0A852ZC88_9ACTN|nr:aldo/keto reductase [Actinopolymorpha rutila]NYH90721.1 aryl-alcohol dehydrogenase-like predicted oxidoreductase [Actinopolymorpha rutila]